jgi:hypothetical protein
MAKTAAQAEETPTPAQIAQAEDVEELRQRIAQLERLVRQPGPPRTLDERMAAVQLELEDVPRAGHARVEKEGRLQYEYDYITEADLMKGVRPLLAKHGIASYYSDEILSYTNGSATVRVRLTFAANGEERECSADGFASDRGDKGANKAKTHATRYLLWKTFLQPSDEDPEQETTSQSEAAAAAQAREERRRASTGDGTTGRGRNTKTPEQRRGEMVQRISTLAVELDDVQEMAAGTTLGRVQDAVRLAYEVALNELPEPAMVKLGTELHGFLGEMRRRVEAGEDASETFELPELPV